MWRVCRLPQRQIQKEVWPHEPRPPIPTWFPLVLQCRDSQLSLALSLSLSLSRLVNTACSATAIASSSSSSARMRLSCRCTGAAALEQAPQKQHREEVLFLGWPGHEFVLPRLAEVVTGSQHVAGPSKDNPKPKWSQHGSPNVEMCDVHLAGSGKVGACCSANPPILFPDRVVGVGVGVGVSKGTCARAAAQPPIFFPDRVVGTGMGMPCLPALARWFRPFLGAASKRWLV